MIKFSKPDPAHHNPAVIAATFELQSVDGAQRGLIYIDGKCSCGEAKAGGDCRHMKAWRERQQKRLVAIGDGGGITAVARDFEEELEQMRRQDAEAAAMFEYDEARAELDDLENTYNDLVAPGLGR